MNLLFQREQTAGTVGKPKFKLYGKVELDDDEQAMVKRYQFDDAILIVADQPKLIRNSALVAVGTFILGYIIFGVPFDGTVVQLLSLLAAGGAGYYYYHQKRETIFVKDLIHGRHFSCDSVVELARKEAWLETITAFLRQVMESAKHWDGTETHTIDPLPKEEARQVILRGV